MADKIFTKDVIQRYVNYHRVLQAVIAIVSNSRVGVDVSNKDFFPSGIYKTEGGVRVNNNEIVIKRAPDGYIYCKNDWNDKEKDVSKVVKAVVEEILSIDIKSGENVGEVLIAYATKNTNMPEKLVREELCQFVANPHVGDPLSSLFR